MQVIHSLPGRLRVGLRKLENNPGLASFLEESLVLAQGVTQVRASCASGRLLVVYTPDILSQAGVKRLISRVLAAEKCRPGPGREKGLPNKKNAASRRPYELERLPLARQYFLTAASGFLLLYVFLRPKKMVPGQGAGVTELANLETFFTILTGYPIFKTALDHLGQKGRPTCELLAGAAAIASLAARESRLGLFILWLTYLSTLLRTLAQEHAKDRIRVMLQGKQPVARLKTPAGQVIVPGTQVSPGSLVLVGKGERVPVDGPVLQGTALVSMCPVKGGPTPVVVSQGGAVYAGSLLLQGRLYIKAERAGEGTYINRVIQLLEKDGPRHPLHSLHTARLMNRLSYLSLAVSTGIFLVTRDAGRAVATLVAGTPGAAGLASSLAFGTGAGAAARQGILIKAVRHVESMAAADTILFGRTALLSENSNHGPETVSMLRRAGVRHIGLLAGTSSGKAGAPVTCLKLVEAWPECGPQEKAAIISRLRQQGRIIAVAAEADSDAAALSAADVGLTMARAGDLNLGSANVIITGGDPRKVAVFRVLARQILLAARQNTAVSAGANLLGLTFGITGSLTPLTLALLQNLGTAAILLNSGRLLLPARVEIKGQPPVCAEAAASLDTSQGILPLAAANCAARDRVRNDTAVLPEAIKEGRNVYDNIRKCVRYLTTTNIGDGVVILTASLLGGPLPLNALQLIWVNIASDPLVSWLLANGAPEPDVLSRTPRRQTENIFDGGLGPKIFSRGLAMGLGAFALYRGSLGAGEGLQLTRTKTMAALGLGRLFHLLDCCRENRRPDGKPRLNKGVKWGGGVILASLAGAMYVPFVRTILNTVPLDLRQWLPVFFWSGLGAVADRGVSRLTERGKNTLGSRVRRPGTERPGKGERTNPAGPGRPAPPGCSAETPRQGR